LHTGLNITLTFIPAPQNYGIKIKRVDLPEQPVIDALAENVTHTVRGTVLQKEDVQISTVEHGLASLYAFGIDNCLLEVNAPEFPILDGSSKHYVQKIQEAGVEEQSAEKIIILFTKRLNTAFLKQAQESLFYLTTRSASMSTSVLSRRFWVTSLLRSTILRILQRKFRLPVLSFLYAK